MTEDEMVSILKEIRDTLNKLLVCFEDDYVEAQIRQEKMEKLKSILTDKRAKVFPLLFNENHYSQGAIGIMVGLSQPAVSGFVNLLIQNEIIEQREENGTIIFVDKYGLVRKVNLQYL